jgi:hypothetical protein
MAKRLLDRQARLLDYLTSAAAIFGEDGDASPDDGLHGLDRRLLRLEARVSFEKRMAKIVAVFPKTFAMLDGKQSVVVREFAEVCPPSDISRIVNARQFYDFLSARWQCEPGEPRYLLDVAACELAFAQVRVDLDERNPIADRAKRIAPRFGIRRRPAVILLRCSHDVRRIFEEANGEHVEPSERDSRLAVTMPPGAVEPAIFELLPVVFDLLAALDDWTDPATLGGTAELSRLLDELIAHRLLEAHP